MIARLGAALSRASARALPDPFVLALALTLIVFVAGWLHLGPSAEHAWVLLEGWLAGFKQPELLAFALQMCLVLVTGHALALSPVVQRIVRRVARIPRGPAQAAALVSFVACLAAILQWGLGAIVGAFLAREIARHGSARGLRLHYPLLGAAAYAGLAVWHGGLSGTAPLKVAQAGHFAEHLVGVVPASATLFSPLNLVVTGSFLVLLPLLFASMVPRDPAEWVGATSLPPLPEARAEEAASIPGWLRETRAVGMVVGAMGLAAVLGAWLTGRASFDLNLVILLFLFLGLIAQGRFRAYTDAVADGAKGAGAIILQFPFYFGILGVMKAAGLIDALSEALVAFAGPESFPPLAFLSAGVVNLVVPSGGGQWAVQGEVLLSAAREMGVEPGVAVMAFSYGDAWTNTLQPFWALPLLGIMGLRARDIIGYTAVVTLLMGVLVPVLLTMLS